jgi:glycosyltransferase involved in cell wall biosynthesis
MSTVKDRLIVSMASLWPKLDPRNTMQHISEYTNLDSALDEIPTPAMKILHIASGDLWAGAECQLFTLLTALRASSDITVTAAILNPGTLANKLQAAGIETLVLDENQQNPMRILWQLQDFIKTQRPDVMHTHRHKENILGGILARYNRLPSVRTQHGSSEHQHNSSNPRQRLLHQADYLVGRLLQYKLVAVSDALASEMQTKYPAAQLTVIYNGINTATQSAAPLTHFQRPLQIGIVGRLAPVKRVDIFLETIRCLLTDTMPTGTPQFYVIGDGPLLGDLKQQASDLGIEAHVSFEGHIDDAEQRIARLDLLVICSDHEGLPMVALEAMKHQTLILTHAIGGLPTLLGEGSYGYLASAQTPESFREAINDIRARQTDMMQCCADARQQLINHYSSTKMARQYGELYRQAMHQHVATNTVKDKARG